MSQLLTQSPSLSLWYHLSRESPLQVSEDQPLYVGDYVVNFERRGDLYKYSLSTAQHGGESLLPQSTKVGFFDSALSMIIVRATLLDKPLIVRLKEPIHIAPRSHLNLRVSRPLSVQIIAAHKTSELTLIHRPITPMRLTSYGEITKPMVCYHWTSDPVTHPQSENEALVPLRIENQTKHGVEMKKIVLYRGLLKLFKTHQYLVTNEVKVLITSKSEASMKYMSTPPATEEKAELIFEPKEEGAPRLLRRLRLRSQRGIGVEYGF